MPEPSAEIPQQVRPPAHEDLQPKLDRLHRYLGQAEEGQNRMLAVLGEDEPEAGAVREGADAYLACLDEVIALLGELSEGAIPAALQTEPAWPGLAQRLSRLWECHTGLMERLGQQQQAVGARLGHLRQGARTVSGYGPASAHSQARFLDHSG
jgi:hypothetical protein